jgi:anti-anti-sigma factor
MTTVYDAQAQSVHRLSRSTGSFSAALLSGEEGDPDTAVLSVRGEIDLGTAPVLLELLRPVLERGTGPVVVDLSEVPFMDSTGVHLLLDTFQQLEDQSRRLAITCRERGQVHRLFALVGLLDAVTVHRSLESALTEGDDLIRSEPRTDMRLSHARAL